MDINAALNEIIFKYHLDQCYPQYKKMAEAEKILRSVIRYIIDNNRKSVFVGNDKTGIEFIRNISRNCEYVNFILCDKKKSLSSQLEAVDWEKYDAIYLISFYGAEYFEDWFRMHNVQYNWIYDIFEQEGVFLQRDFFLFGKEDLFNLISQGGIHTSNGVTESVQCELYCQQSKYESARDPSVKHMALKKCLFLTLYMRNFVAAEKYFLLLAEESKKFESAWKEIQGLLESIKRKINRKEQEDIILYWLDGIPYGDEKDMPYFQNIMRNSIVFENAFSYIANTHPVLREMFLGKKDTDNHTYNLTMITQENSSLMGFLEEQGYDIRIISGYFNRNFPYKYVSEQFYIEWYVPSSMVFWDMLANILKQKQKTLYVIHAMDAHFPYLSSKIRKDNYMNHSERYRLAKQELDQQLAFYDAFIDRDTLRIYMSDHGNTGIKRHHVLFNIYNRKIKAKKIENFFSFVDFETVLRQIVINGDIQEWKFTKKCAEIGRLDRYNFREIRSVFENKAGLPLEYIGYKGIIDKEYVYVRYNTGKEWMQRRDSIPLDEPLLFYDSSSDICEVDLVPQYRKMTVEYPKDLMEDEKFQYSRYLYKLYCNISRHNNMIQRMEAINVMLKNYPDRSVAIRMGGVASSRLYYVLSKENKRKIWGFIDRDDKCLCSRLDFPIIHPSQIGSMKDMGVKAILFASFTWLDLCREEAKALPVDIAVLDIYEYFNNHGIKCKENFYILSGTDEDYDVGFPFDGIMK